MKRRSISLVLALVMCLALLPAAALAAESDFVIDESGTLTKYNGPGGDVVIPSTVKVIRGGAFFRCQSMTSVTIPDSVTEIQNQVFQECTGLTEVVIPDSVTIIGNNAFDGCTGLKTVKLSKHLTSIGYQAFKSCTSMTEFTIPDSVAKIEGDIFYNCTALSTVHLGSGVAKVDGAAFGGCYNISAFTVVENNPNLCAVDGVLFTRDMTQLIKFPSAKPGAYVIPNGVIEIREWAFDACSELTAVTFPDSVTTVESYQFNACHKLASVTLPKRLDKWVVYLSFQDCDSLTDFVFPEGTVVIASHTLSKCKNLKTLTLPASVELIYGALYDSDVADIYFGGTQEQWAAVKVDTDWMVPFPACVVNAKVHCTDGLYKPVVEPGVTIDPDPHEYLTLGASNSSTTIANPTSDNGRKVSDWAAASVDRAFSIGIGSDFSTKDCTIPITRKQFAHMAIELFSYTAYTGTLPEIGASPFTDVDDIGVTIAYELGIVSGYGNGRFGPDDLITREQAAVMLANLAATCGKPMAITDTPYTDAGSFSSWAADSIAKCYGAGIMGGVGGDRFDAQGSYTIEQSLVTMVRTYEFCTQ